MINLYIGDAQEYLVNAAKQADPGAILVDSTNYHQFLKDDYSNGTLYTSLADLPKIGQRNILYELMLKSDTIFYCPPGIWSDKNSNFSWESQETLLEFLLSNVHNQRHNVVGIDNLKNRKLKYLQLFDQRPNSDPCLWIAGCSISLGVGVDKEQRYGSIVAKELNIASSFLTKGGTSIEVHSDQILRSDIRKGDIVIWGLTSELRAPRFFNSLTAEQNLDVRTSETRLYKAITSVYQVSNFCKNVSANLIMLPLICTEHLRLALSDNEYYHDLPYQAAQLDYGTDNLHPGVRQHRAWADFCINLLKEKI